MEFSFDRFYRINRRAIIWIVLFAIVYFLRSYFLLIFLTFIIGFFAIRISRFLMERLHMSRDLSIAVVYVAILVGYIGTVSVMAIAAATVVAFFPRAFGWAGASVLLWLGVVTGVRAVWHRMRARDTDAEGEDDITADGSGDAAIESRKHQEDE